MSYKSKYVEMFKGCESMTRDKAIESVMKKGKISKGTAQTHYYQWKKEFMGGANCVPAKPDIPEAKPDKEKKPGKSFVDAIIETQWPETEEEAKEYTGVIIARDPEEPENDMVIECDDAEDMKVYVDKCKAQGYEVKTARFKPVVIQGEYHSYHMDSEGIRIESGDLNYITASHVEELADALAEWSKHYE